MVTARCSITSWSTTAAVSARIHDHDDLPTVITGKGNGLFHLGRHVTYPTETPLANLHVAMMNQMGIPPRRLPTARASWGTSQISKGLGTRD
jgi:hypothetical protein